jgi:hypothetical protein
MHDLEILREALRMQHPHAWVNAALMLVTKPGTSYVGKSTKAVPASHLVRIYNIRLEHLRKRGQPPMGMEHLLQMLRELPNDAEVTIKPFVSDDTTLVASFWDSDRLIGCIIGDSETADV